MQAQSAAARLVQVRARPADATRTRKPRPLLHCGDQSARGDRRAGHAYAVGAVFLRALRRADAVRQYAMMADAAADQRRLHGQAAIIFGLETS